MHLRGVSIMVAIKSLRQTVLEMMKLENEVIALWKVKERTPQRRGPRIHGLANKMMCISFDPILLVVQNGMRHFRPVRLKVLQRRYSGVAIIIAEETGAEQNMMGS
jgi:hypothetical protein